MFVAKFSLNTVQLLTAIIILTAIFFFVFAAVNNFEFSIVEFQTLVADEIDASRAIADM